mmetsp:Transcript_101226/g.326220  ORF Transcript_101226/g.326220 Transcript_101226/m.326220 type:complete len:251 (+) Transcript_101226:961-1713(+)
MPWRASAATALRSRGGSRRGRPGSNPCPRASTSQTSRATPPRRQGAAATRPGARRWRSLARSGHPTQPHQTGASPVRGMFSKRRAAACHWAPTGHPGCLQRVGPCTTHPRPAGCPPAPCSGPTPARPPLAPPAPWRGSQRPAPDWRPAPPQRPLRPTAAAPLRAPGGQSAQAARAPPSRRCHRRGSRERRRRQIQLGSPNRGPPGPHPRTKMNKGPSASKFGTRTAEGFSQPLHCNLQTSVCFGTSSQEA